jgi:signal transduction histidine kinase
VAIYSAAAYASKPLVALAIGAVGVGIRDLTDPLIDGFGAAIWSSSLFGLCFIAGLAGRNLRRRTSKLDERADALEREEAERAAAAAEAERRRIARELHDIIQHSLGVLVLQAGAAEQVLERDPERAREALRSIRATGQEAIGEMGTLLGVIRGGPETSHEPQPSLADIERLIAKTRDAGLDAELEIEGKRRALPAALELSAFRIVQEGLTNALKHAGPAHARVLLRFGEHELEVEVLDDGAGSGDGRGGRRGLAGIGERVAIFSGELEAGPRPDGGWRLRAALPLPR